MVSLSQKKKKKRNGFSSIQIMNSSKKIVLNVVSDSAIETSF